ncbi:MAG TPA: hypothetical protein ENN46_03445 [Candidatus Woesearchaeota archaeon]|nr:hypothetical protein [Candidatus Woesearchaeota archaeon]
MNKAREPFLLLCAVLIIASFSSPALAEQDGKSTILYVSDRSDCSTPGDNFNAGDTVYVRVNLTNTGDVDLINARIFVIDSFDGNYGRYTHGTRFVNLNVGENITYCYPMQTLSTYKEGRWRGLFYFRNFNSGTLDSTKTFHYNITNPGLYESISLGLVPHENPITVQIGESKSYTLRLVNRNPDDEFNGRVWVNLLTFSDGTTSKNVNVPPGGTLEFDVTTVPQDHPRRLSIGVYANGHLNQNLIRRWYTYITEGPIYRYIVRQLFASASIFASGESGTIRAYVRNDGNAEWNSDCCYYRFRLRAKNPSTGSWVDLLDENIDYTSHPPGSTIWYESSEFTNTFSETLTDFTVYFYSYGEYGFMDRWGGYTAQYSAANYPDITASCSSDDYEFDESSGDIIIRQRCDAGPDSIVFIRRLYGDLVSIEPLSGSLNNWWEGSMSGFRGFFLNGAQNSVYEITYKIEAVRFNTPGMQLSWVSVLASASALLLLSFLKKKSQA